MIAGGAAEIGFADFKFLYHIQTNLMIDNSCFIFVLLRYSLSADKLHQPTKKISLNQIKITFLIDLAKANSSGVILALTASS